MATTHLIPAGPVSASQRHGCLSRRHRLLGLLHPGGEGQRGARKTLDICRHSVIVHYNSMRAYREEETHEVASYRPARRFHVAPGYRADRGAAAAVAPRHATACAYRGAATPP